MISRVIEWSLRHRAAVIAVYVVLGVWGVVALRTSPVDAIPDLSDPQVIVFTDWAGHSAQEVEDQVTYPVTVNLQGLPGVRVVRSRADFSLDGVVDSGDLAELAVASRQILDRNGLHEVSIFASGNLIHNLHTYAWGRHLPGPYDWASRFESRAKELILAAAVFGTDDALAWGLIHMTAPVFELEERAQGIARALAEANPAAVRKALSVR